MEIYNETSYLGDGVDMAKKSYKAYKIDDEIHLVYDGYDSVSKEKIQKIKENLDEYLWTPFIEWV
jgi:hypothetical protein